MTHEQPTAENPEMMPPTPATLKRFCDLAQKLVEGHEDKIMGAADEAIKGRDRESPVFFSRSFDLGAGRELSIDLDFRKKTTPRYEVGIKEERESPTGQKIIKNDFLVIEGGVDSRIISEQIENEDGGFVGFDPTEADLRKIIEKLEFFVEQEREDGV